MMMKNEVNINISSKVFAPVYLANNCLADTSRFLLLYGGAGSGKSWFACGKIIYRMLSEDGHTFLGVRKHAVNLKETMYNLIKATIEAWGLESLFEFRLSPLEIRCVNGNRMIFRGTDDVEKLKSIFGITGVWIEEASELSLAEFEQLNLRIRGNNLKHYVQYILSFNPVSEDNWLKLRFFDMHDADATIIKTTYLDNPFLDEQYKRNMEKLKETNPDYYRIYALGDWGSLGSIIYSNYQVKEIPTKASDYPIVYSGLDFGFNDPSAYVRIGIKDNELYVFDELYQTELTNPELIEIIKTKQSLDDWLICDSAEPDRIKEFKKAGFLKAKPAEKGQGSIKFGIDLIKSHKVYIHPRCENFIKEIRSYKYKEDKAGRVYDEPVDFNNHLMDAMRYAMEMKKQKKKVKAGLSLY
jgi:phage terminase large subunit